MKKKIKILKEKLEKLLKLMAVDFDDIEFSEEEDSLWARIKTGNPGILIGFKGNNLDALQLIAGLMLYRQTGEWTAVRIDVGDYRQKRQEQLNKLAQNSAQKVKFSGEEVRLSNLNPFERRIVHLSLADHPDVETESTGEGRDRILIVKPKKK